MGSVNPPPELSLDFIPAFIPKTITQFLGEVSRIASVPDKIIKLDDFVNRLETEMRKIDAFKRELPLCMLLINDAIVALKEKLMAFKKLLNAEPVLEEFIPLKKSCEEDAKVENIRKEIDSGDKKNWLSSTQLWSTNDNNPNTNQKPNSVEKVIKKRASKDEDNGMIDDLYLPCRNSGKTFIPFKGYCGFTVVDTTRKEDKDEMQVPGLSLITPGIKNTMRGNRFLTKTGANSRLVPGSVADDQSNIPAGGHKAQPPHQQTSRKQRRCWSAELHRRFVNALQQLGGSQAATPKQIRELMQVDGLTNDEVKSHLQKYRLHAQRLPSSNSPANQSAGILGGLWTSSNDQYVESSNCSNSQSGSPDGPLLRGTTGGTSTTGGDSMDDGEDEKSENYGWKGQLNTSVNDV